SYLSTPTEDIVDSAIEKQTLIESNDFKEYIDKKTRSFLIDSSKALRSKKQYEGLNAEEKADPLVANLLSSPEDKYKIDGIERDRIALGGIKATLGMLIESTTKEDSPEFR